jgi:hypothetical protein
VDACLAGVALPLPGGHLVSQPALAVQAAVQALLVHDADLRVLPAEQNSSSVLDRVAEELRAGAGAAAIFLTDPNVMGVEGGARRPWLAARRGDTRMRMERMLLDDTPG